MPLHGLIPLLLEDLNLLLAPLDLLLLGTVILRYLLYDLLLLLLLHLVTGQLLQNLLLLLITHSQLLGQQFDLLLERLIFHHNLLNLSR
jgi:hypothetical protein